jgi:hypothetical protein
MRSKFLIQTKVLKYIKELFHTSVEQLIDVCLATMYAYVAVEARNFVFTEQKEISRGETRCFQFELW